MTSPITYRHNLEELKINGFTAVSTGLSSQAVLWRAESLQLLDFFLATAKAKLGGQELGLGKDRGYRELVQKDKGRYDINMDFLLPSRAGHLHGNNLKVPGFELMNAVQGAMLRAITPLLEDTLGGEFVQNAQGFVVSYPSTAAQSWHVDVSPLFGAHEIREQTPAYFYTVFMPLYDPRTPGIGPTQLVKGSFHQTGGIPRRTVPEQYPSDSVVESVCRASEGVVLMDCQPGDVFVMDGRTLHRGLANTSETVRPLVYMSFCRPWYYEWPRSHADNHSLFM